MWTWQNPEPGVLLAAGVKLGRSWSEATSPSDTRIVVWQKWEWLGISYCVQSLPRLNVGIPPSFRTPRRQRISFRSFGILEGRQQISGRDRLEATVRHCAIYIIPRTVFLAGLTAQRPCRANRLPQIALCFPLDSGSQIARNTRRGSLGIAGRRGRPVRSYSFVEGRP